MAKIDVLIKGMLTGYELLHNWHILDKAIPENIDRCLAQPLQPKRPFFEQDIQAPPPVKLPAEEL